MTDIETRLRGLAAPSLSEQPTPASIRARAKRRTARRRKGLAIVLIVAMGGAVLGIAQLGDGPEHLTAGPGTTTPPPLTEPGPEQGTIGEVAGVTVSVTPHGDLVDGELVEITVEGLENLPGAVVTMCAGDVTGATAIGYCDLAAVQDPNSVEPGQVVAQPEQTVSVARTLNIGRGSPDPNVPVPYDCATEPAGCVLAVGVAALPVRAVVVPLEFSDVPITGATVSVEPATQLRASQPITVTATGLRPNAIHEVQVCSAPTAAALCDGYQFASVTTDGQGRLSTELVVWPVLYTFRGQVDCTTESCAVSVRDRGTVAQTEIRFIEGLVPPTPMLRIEPAGPYRDGQEVTIVGSGFPPGIDLSGDIGQCPADKDTAVEERCGYDLRPVATDRAGSFTTTRTLYTTSPFGVDWATDPGSVLGWVLNHGPTVAVVELDFVQ
jgi:hypothetical protein